jgi:hypothetical protein
MTLKSLDPRLRGDDGLGWARRNPTGAMPRNPSAVVPAKPTRRHACATTYRHAREGGHPGLYRDMALKPLDPRLRGDDDLR